MQESLYKLGIVAGTPEFLKSPLTEMGKIFSQFNDGVEKDLKPEGKKDFTGAKKRKTKNWTMSVEEDLMTVPLKPFCSVEEALADGRTVLNVQKIKADAECPDTCEQ